MQNRYRNKGPSKKVGVGVAAAENRRPRPKMLRAQDATAALYAAVMSYFAYVSLALS